MDWAIVRLLFKWLLEQPDGKQTDKLGDLYFLEESYEKISNREDIIVNIYIIQVSQIALQLENLRFNALSAQFM